MFFGSNDFPIDRVRETLEAAKASRKPVVVVADLKLGDSTADISAFGKQAWDIDEFLAELRGNFVVLMSPDRVAQTTDQRRMASDAEETFRRGDISQEELDVRLGRIQEEAYARRIADRSEEHTSERQ